MLVASIPVRELVTYAMLDPAPRSGSLDAVQSSYNRPIDEGHAQEFASYLVDNITDPFVPAFSLNATEHVEIHWVPKVDETEVAVPMAMLIVPRQSRLVVIDGQHRIMGLRMAYEHAAKTKNRVLENMLDTMSVPILVTFEGDIRKSHLDFFDASRTKPLPSSQLAAYDTRNVARALLTELVHEVPIFAGPRVDFTSATIRKRCSALWLFSQIYSAEKTFLTGSYAMNEQDFDARAKRDLRRVGTPEYDAARERIIAFFRDATQAIAVLRSAASMEDDHLLDAVTKWREEGVILFTLPGLSVLARIGYDIRELPQSEQQAMIARLGRINWRRDAKIWHSIGLVHGDRIVSAHKVIESAAKAVEAEIGAKGIITGTEKSEEEVVSARK